MFLNPPIQPVSDGPCVLKSQDQLSQSQPEDLCIDGAITYAGAPLSPRPEVLLGAVRTLARTYLPPCHIYLGKSRP